MIFREQVLVYSRPGRSRGVPWRASSSRLKSLDMAEVHRHVGRGDRRALGLIGLGPGFGRSRPPDQAALGRRRGERLVVARTKADQVR